MITRIEKFGASWCGPCKVLDRTLEQISRIVKHNVDEEEELANSKGIRNVPVLIYYNDRDEEVKRTIGAVSLGTIMQTIINMYRVLLSRTGVAYAKECDDELDEFDFIDVLRDFVDSGDVIIFVDDLDTLRDSMELEYKIEVVNGDE